MRIRYPRTIIGTCAVTIHVVCVVPVSTWAEGGDRRSGSDYGINRRVRSTEGYVAASGTFSSSFDLPSRHNRAVASSPSFYLGGTGKDFNNVTLEVDAGLQFDDYPPHGLIHGWTAFISVNRNQVNPRLWDETLGWHAWRGPADRDYDLKYVVEGDGTLRLDVSGGLGAFYWFTPASDADGNGRPDNVPEGTRTDSGAYIGHAAGHDTWPWIGESVMRVANFDSQTVKRVIAITQAGQWKGNLDGTVFTCAFSGGTIFPFYNRSGTGWTPDHAAQEDTLGGTGYDTPQNLANPYAWDALEGNKQGPHSQMKVQFPDVDQRWKVPKRNNVDRDIGNPIARTNIRPNSWEVTQGGVTRYQQETVVLSLRQATQPKVTSYRARHRSHRS